MPPDAVGCVIVCTEETLFITAFVRCFGMRRMSYVTYSDSNKWSSKKQTGSLRILSVATSRHERQTAYVLCRTEYIVFHV